MRLTVLILCLFLASCSMDITKGMWQQTNEEFNQDPACRIFEKDGDDLKVRGCKNENWTGTYLKTDEKTYKLKDGEWILTIIDKKHIKISDGSSIEEYEYKKRKK